MRLRHAAAAFFGAIMAMHSTDAAPLEKHLWKNRLLAVSAPAENSAVKEQRRIYRLRGRSGDGERSRQMRTKVSADGKRFQVFLDAEWPKTNHRESRCLRSGAHGSWPGASRLACSGWYWQGGAIEATSGPVRLILSMLHRDGATAFAPPLRFSLAVLGAVSLGWAVTLSLIINAAIDLGGAGRPLWNAITAGLVSWFVIDSTLSMVNGFGLNVLPNVIMAGMYVIGLIGSGALKKSP